MTSAGRAMQRLAVAIVEAFKPPDGSVPLVKARSVTARTAGTGFAGDGLELTIGDLTATFDETGMCIGTRLAGDKPKQEGCGHENGHVYDEGAEYCRCGKQRDVAVPRARAEAERARQEEEHKRRQQREQQAQTWLTEAMAAQVSRERPLLWANFLHGKLSQLELWEAVTSTGSSRVGKSYCSVCNDPKCDNPNGKH